MSETANPVNGPITGQITDAERRALTTLEAARPLGLARIRGGFKGIAGAVGLNEGRALTAAQLARIDYSGRHPRLKITRQGRALVAAKENR